MNDFIGNPPDAKETVKTVEKSSEAKGLDVGTMNLVASYIDSSNTVISKSMRNVFLETDLDSVGTLELDEISHVVIDEQLFILSQHAFDFGNMFGRDVSRPMKDGMISSTEEDAVDVIAAMVKLLIGKNSNSAPCVFSVPANPVDSDTNIIFHEGLFTRIIEALGYKAYPLNEATAIIYSEAADTNFSGIGISFGAGMTNVAIVYKSIPTVTFSIARGGDWIDQQVATWTGAVRNRITKIKENELDLENLTYSDEKNKKKRNIKSALNQYYENLIQYTMNTIIQELEKTDVDLPEELPIIISGGTSLVKGFIGTVGKVVNDYDFPFDISEVRHASNPLTSVSQGCLIKGLRL